MRIKINRKTNLIVYTWKCHNSINSLLNSKSEKEISKVRCIYANCILRLYIPK